MKKIIAITAALLAASQAYSSDWSFYGSARAGTFGQTVVDTGSNGKSTNSKSYVLQGNSRFGANVVADSNVSGKIEYGLASVFTGPTSTTTTPSLRLLYGKWKINSDVSLTLGQAWSIINYINSNQIWGGDNNLLAEGGISLLREKQLTLSAHGFNLSFVPGAQAAISVSTALNYATRNDNLPKVEAAYDYAIGPAHIGVGAAYNGYSLDAVNAAKQIIRGPGKYSTSYDISNYLGVVDFGFKSSVINVNASAGYIVNGNEIGLITTNPFKAYVDTTGKLINATTINGYIDANATFGIVTPELGVGVESHSQDFYGKSATDTRITVYLQASIAPVKRVTFVPEVGLTTESLKPAGGKSYDLPNVFYYGAKSQIDF